MPNVELFIPCAPKDYIKLPYVLDSVAQYLPDISAAHITTRERIDPILERAYDWANVMDQYVELFKEPSRRYRFPVHYHLDSEILDFDYTRFKFRPTWIYQQFLKLFQTVTTTDWYLVMDADRFINKPLSLFNGNRPVMFLRDRDEQHAPYFEYSQKMLGVGKVYPHSFLSECTLYKQSLIEDMLISIDLTYKEWLNRSAEIIDATCCPADAELYGSWVYSQHPDLYEYRILADCMAGKYEGEGAWTAEEIGGYVAEMALHPEFDFFTAHSWHD